MEILTQDTSLFYAGAVAYKESRTRDEFLKKMSDFNRNECLIIWYAIDAYSDLYEPFAGDK